MTDSPNYYFGHHQPRGVKPSFSSFGLDDDTHILKVQSSIGSTSSPRSSDRQNKNQIPSVKQIFSKTSGDLKNGGNRMTIGYGATNEDQQRSQQQQSQQMQHNLKSPPQNNRHHHHHDDFSRMANKQSYSYTRLSNGSKPLFEDHLSLMGKLLFILVTIILFCYTFTILFGELLLLPMDKSDWCQSYDSERGILPLEGGGSGDHAVPYGTIPLSEKQYENPDYVTDPCRYERVKFLFYLTVEECDLSRRMLASVILGGAIGYERRASDRPAGIRTMGLVSLGACFFTISSQLGFKSSTMGWDSSRVTAAIPSGVGFLGAGLIWKGTVDVGSGESCHQVHGLTTAASLWLSAAVGVSAGGGLYFTSIYATALVLIILKYGPKMYFQDDASYGDNDQNISDTEQETSDAEVKDIDSNNPDRESDDDDDASYNSFRRKKKSLSAPLLINLPDLHQYSSSSNNINSNNTPNSNSNNNTNGNTNPPSEQPNTSGLAVEHPLLGCDDTEEQQQQLPQSSMVILNDEQQKLLWEKALNDAMEYANKMTAGKSPERKTKKRPKKSFKPPSFHH